MAWPASLAGTLVGGEKLSCNADLATKLTPVSTLMYATITPKSIRPAIRRRQPRAAPFSFILSGESSDVENTGFSSGINLWTPCARRP